MLVSQTDTLPFFLCIDILAHLSKINSILNITWVGVIEQAQGHWNHPDHIHTPILFFSLLLLFEPVAHLYNEDNRDVVRSELVNIYKMPCTEPGTYCLPLIPLDWKHHQYCQPSRKKLKQQRCLKGILSWWDPHYHKQLLYVPIHSPNQRSILPLCRSLPANLYLGDTPTPTASPRLLTWDLGQTIVNTR